MTLIVGQTLTFSDGTKRPIAVIDEDDEWGIGVLRYMWYNEAGEPINPNDPHFVLE